MIASLIPPHAGHFEFQAMIRGIVVDESGENDGVYHVTVRDGQKVIDLIRATGAEYLCVEDMVELSKEEMFTS